MNETESPRTPFRTRLIAILILGICGWILLKFLIGLITGIATLVVIVLCVFGIIWAFSKF